MRQGVYLSDNRCSTTWENKIRTRDSFSAYPRHRERKNFERLFSFSYYIEKETGPSIFVFP